MATVADILKEARQQLSEKEPYRWLNFELITYLNDGLRSLFGDRPEAFYINDVVITPPTALSLTTDILPIDPLYNVAIVHYVVQAALGEDSEDAANRTLSNEHLMKFKGVID